MRRCCSSECCHTQGMQRACSAAAGISVIGWLKELGFPYRAAAHSLGLVLGRPRHVWDATWEGRNVARLVDGRIRLVDRIDEFCCA